MDIDDVLMFDLLKNPQFLTDVEENKVVLELVIRDDQISSFRSIDLVRDLMFDLIHRTEDPMTYLLNNFIIII